MSKAQHNGGAAFYSADVLTIFVYYLLENWVPPGALKEAVAITHARLRDHSTALVFNDAHVAGLAGRCARQIQELLDGAPVPPEAPVERLHVLMDFAPHETTYKALADDIDAIVADAAGHVRRTIVERMREQSMNGAGG